MKDLEKKVQNHFLIGETINQSMKRKKKNQGAEDGMTNKRREDCSNFYDHNKKEGLKQERDVSLTWIQNEEQQKQQKQQKQKSSSHLEFNGD